MNKIYKLIWSQTANAFVAVSELATARDKSSSTTNNAALGAWVAVSEITKSKGKKSNKAIKSGVLVSSLVLFAGNAIAAPYDAGGGTAAGIDSIAIGERSKALGTLSMALGADSVAQGSESIALGARAKALEKNSTALGSQSAAEKEMDLAVGYNAIASGSLSTAVGFQSKSTGFGSNAIGNYSLAAGYYSTAIGHGAKAEAEYTLAAGHGAIASGKHATAVGLDSKSTGLGSNALGSNSLAAGFYSTAIGHGAKAEAEFTLAAGHGAIASGKHATAVGLDSKSTGLGSNALGSNSLAAGFYSTAIGHGAKAEAEFTLAAGHGAIASGKNATAVGLGSKSTGLASNAIGWKANATAQDATAIGSNAQAYSRNGIAMGTNATVGGGDSVGIGVDSKTGTGSGMVAIGDGASTDNQSNLNTSTTKTQSNRQSTAIGSRAQAWGDQSVSIGNDTKASGNSSIAIGGDDIDKVRNQYQGLYRSITGKNMPSGYVSTESSGAGATAIGVMTTASGHFASALGMTAEASGDGSVAIGPVAKSSGKAGVAIGIESQAKADNAIAIGTGAQATGKQSISVGKGNVVSRDKSGAFGDSTTISGTGSYSVGNNNTIATNDTFVVGSNVTKTLDNSVFLGKNAAYTAKGASTDGIGAVTEPVTVGGTLTYGGFAGKTPVGVVSVGDVGKERRIQNVAAGKIAATSTDAINGSQLYATNAKLGNVANTVVKNFGGNATLNADGNITYTNIGNTGKDNIHDAIQAATTKVAGDKGVSVTPTTNADGSKTYTVAAKTDNKTVKVDDKGNIAAVTAPLTYTDGKVNTPAAPNALATAGDIANAINNSGWKLAADGTSGTELINPSDTVTFKTGSSNLTVKRDGANITYDLAKDIAVDSVKTGDTTVNTYGVSIANADPNKVVSLTASGLNNGNNRITNVAAGTADTDAVNVSQLKAATTTKVEGDKGVSVTPKTNADGSTTYTVAAKTDNTTVKVDNNGNIAAVTTTFTPSTDGKVGAPVGNGDSLVTAKTVADAINNSGWKLAADGTTGTELINPSDTVTFKTGSSNLTVKRNGANITYDLAKDININSVKFGDNGPTIKADASNNINIAKSDGSATKITNVKAGEADTDAVNVSQLKEAANNLVTTGFNIADGKGGNDNVKLGETVTFADPAGNIITTVTDNKVEFGLNSTLSVGKDGEPGKVGIKGADGKDAISLNGEDGTIGINGKDGANATLTVEKGKPGLDGKDGQTRIVYTKPDGSKEEVATLNDGLNFKADDGSIVPKKLNETLEIVGGADKDSLTDNNIGVNNKNGKLTVQLAKDININSVKFGNNGPTIKADASNNINIAKSDGSPTKITNVEAGTGDNDAVNVSQLKAAANNLVTTGFNIADGKGGNDNVKLGETVTFTDPAGNIITTVTDNKVEFGLNRTLSVGKAGEPGKVGIKGADGKDAISLNGKDGTIGINGKDGANATLTVEKAKPALDGKDGQNGEDGQTRIVYTKPNGSKEEVATLNDGLNFKADDGSIVAKKLNETLEIVGGADKDSLTDNNIGVNNKNGKLTVQLAKDININSVKFGANGPTIKADANNNINIAKSDGSATKITNVKAGTGDNDAVNVSQLKEAANNLVTTGFNIADGKGGNDNVKLGETVTFTDPAGNIITTVTDNKVEFGLNRTLSVGKAGEPGKVGIKGADGKDAISLNGKDGTIGINGKDGANATLTVEKAKPALDGKDGQNGEDGQTRIVYTKPNGSKEEVATLNDGLNFKADDGSIVAKKLNETLEIVGGADKDSLTDNNIGVNNKNGKLTVQLAKDININSVKFGNNGPTIKADASNNINIAKSDGSPTKITNVEAGTGDNDAVNVSQLKEAANNLVTTGFNIADGKGGNDNVKLGETVTFTDPAGNIITTVTDNKVEFGLNRTLSVGKAGEPGKVGIKGADGKDAISLNGKDGTIGINGKDGANATLTVEKAKPALDGKDGQNGEDGQTRIVYTKPNGSKEEVATLNDGLNFKADDGSIVAKKLNETLEIVGGADKDSLTDNNIGVNNKNGKLTVQLAKDININSVKFGNNGPTIKADASNNINIAKSDGSPTKITNVEAGTGDNDAVNVSQLKEAANNLVTTGFNIADGKGGNDNVKLGETVTFTDPAGNIITTVTDNKVEFGLNRTLSVGKAGEPGKVGIKGADGKDAISLNGKDGTIGINGKDGANATLTVEKAKPALDGKDGQNGEDGQTRIVYTKPNGSKEEVATLNDGLNFGANAGTNHAAKLNSLVDIKGADANTDWSKFDQGANIMTNVTTDANGNGRITVGLAKDLKGIDSITVNNGPVISGNGIDMNGDKITNVAAGTADTDAVNVSQLKAVEATANKGWNLTTNGKADSKSNVKPGDTVDFANTDGNVKIENTGNKVTVNLNKDIDLTKDGSVTIGDTKVNNDGLTIVGGPSVTKSGIDAGDKKITNVADGVISATSKDAVNGSQLYQAVNNINTSIAASKEEVKSADGSVTVTTTQNAKGANVYDLSVNTDGTTIKKNADGSLAVNTTPLTNNADGTVKTPTAPNAIATAGDIANAINNSGFTLTAKGSNGSLVKPGATVDMNNTDGNIVISKSASDNNVTYNLAKNVKVDSVTAGDTVMGTDGITINNGSANGNTVSLTKDGLNNGGNRITNVAPGVNGTDAVNVNQLQGLSNNINSRMDGIENNSNAGTAAAMAVAGLPQAYLPGKSMMAVAGGVYRGESGYAIGFSSISDGGNWVIKGTASGNSRGHYGATAGVGYQW